ncbi:radical SAM protein [Desulfovibrio sp. OttesenSCG-928-G15]|nr:radical SAM protein [Desulfovibrio sp. OttesenSCG-928-G15]
MQYCHRMVSELNIEPDHVRPCCVGGANVPALPMDDNRLDMAQYRKFAYASLVMLQTNLEICRPCPFIVEKDEELHPSIVENLQFKAIAINHHRNICNCRCVYCPFWDVPKEQKTPPRPILPLIQGLVRDHVVEANCLIAWGGGESTLLREFEDAGRWILDKGFRQYVHSNVMRFSPIVATILGQGRGKLNLSLDSWDQESYRQIKGVDGWDKVVATLGKYLRAAKNPEDVEVKYIIFKQNWALESLELFLTGCVNMGVKKVQYSFNGFDISTGRCELEMLQGAAYFRHRARELQLVCTPFYVDAPILRGIDAVEAEMFGNS